jgi:hypothetical protein
MADKKEEKEKQREKEEDASTTTTLDVILLATTKSLKANNNWYNIDTISRFILLSLSDECFNTLDYVGIEICISIRKIVPTL